jgi:hypothetical protein
MEIVSFFEFINFRKHGEELVSDIAKVEFEEDREMPFPGVQRSPSSKSKKSNLQSPKRSRKGSPHQPDVIQEDSAEQRSSEKSQNSLKKNLGWKNRNRRKKKKKKRKRKGTNESGNTRQLSRLNSGSGSSSLNVSGSGGESSSGNKFSKNSAGESIEKLISKDMKRRRKKKKKSRGSKSNSKSDLSSGNLSGESEALSNPISKITYGERPNFNDPNRKKIDLEARPQEGYQNRSPKSKKKSKQNEGKKVKDKIQLKLSNNRIHPMQMELDPHVDKPQSSHNSNSSSTLIQQALIKRKLHVYYEFVEDTLRDDAVYEMTGVTLNIFFMLRLILLEIMMICFQMLPLVQILSMNFLNIAYFLWMTRAVFRDKVVEDTLDVIHMFVLEIAIQVFLIMCIVFWLDRNDDFLGTVGSLVVQMVCVLAVGTAVIFELLMLVFNLIKSISRAYKRRSMMKAHVNGVLAQILGRKELGVGHGINYRGVDKMNARMSRGRRA